MNKTMIYDIIGNIHGQVDKLTHLLNKLDYRLINGVHNCLLKSNKIYLFFAKINRNLRL